MTKKEKELLKKLADCHDGTLTQREFFDRGNQKIARRLVSVGLVAEVSYKNVSSYQLTEKGWLMLGPIYKRFWYFFTNDFAKILSIVATILSITATILSICAFSR